MLSDLRRNLRGLTEERNTGRGDVSERLAVLLVVLVGPHDRVQRLERRHRLLVDRLPRAAQAVDRRRVETSDDVDQGREVVELGAFLIRAGRSAVRREKRERKAHLGDRDEVLDRVGALLEIVIGQNQLCDPTRYLEAQVN